ncbi:MAG TPA: lipoyl(octanoyl) transferase LipB [Candidatus Limnocylindrales bacterium]|jgi:lipoyl(octanoyl) transferase
MDAQSQDSPTLPPRPGAPITAWWLGRTAYRDAWQLQHRLVAARADGLIGDQILLLEHEPVLTLGRHSDPSHVVASPAELAARHVELIQTERGGEVTYHGPGQLTAYIIVRLADRSLYVRSMVRALESGLTEACAALGVAAEPKPGYPGCWCGDGARKIGAVGVRVERGVTYHGIALNVTVRLDDFDLIDACGMPGVESTSISRELGEPSEPTTESVGRAGAAFAVALSGAMGAQLLGSFAPLADPVACRAELDALLAELMPEPAPESAIPASSLGASAPMIPPAPRPPIVRAH